MEYFTQYVRPELLILIPVLYFFGVILRKASFMAERWIPLLLGIIGVALCAIYGFATTEVHNLKDGAMLLFMALTQGVMVSGASVFCHQIYKKFRKKESGDTESTEEDTAKKEP